MCFNYWTPPTVLILLLVLHLFPNATALPLLSRDQMLPSPPPPNCLLGPRPIFFSLSNHPDGALLPPRLSPAQQRGGRPEQQLSDNGRRERRAVSDSGRGCTFHIFTPQIPPPDVQTSECSSTPLLLRWPPTHPRTHAHTSVPRQPSGRRNSSNEAILLTTALLWKLGLDDALWGWDVSRGYQVHRRFCLLERESRSNKVCWSQLPAAVDHRAVSLKPLSLALPLSSVVSEIKNTSGAYSDNEEVASECIW